MRPMRNCPTETTFCSGQELFYTHRMRGGRERGQRETAVVLQAVLTVTSTGTDMQERHTQVSNSTTRKSVTIKKCFTMERRQIHSQMAQ